MSRPRPAPPKETADAATLALARRHPSQPLYTLIVGLGGLLAGLGLLLGLLGVYVGLAYAVFGGLVTFLGLFGRRVGSGVMLVNASLAKLSQGQLAESERLLDHVEATNKLGYLMRPLLLQRTMIALRRGDTRAALAAADRAVSIPLGAFGRAPARIHRVHALGLRAVVKASEGDAEGAMRDVAEVRASPDAAAQALARAALSEALVMERRGERAELRDHLERHARLLEQGTEPRERTIIRAMHRMLRAPSSTVYRVAPAPASRDPRAEPGVSEWLERIAPGLAEYEPREGPAEARPDDDAYRATGKVPLRSKAARRRGWDARVIAAVAIGAIGYVVWSSAGAEATPTTIEPGLPPAFDLLALMMVLIVSILVYRVVRARRDGKALIAGTNALARGDEQTATELLGRLSDSSLDLVAAQADLALSALNEQRGELKLALSACERGLGRLTHYAARVAAADLLTPELAAQRAFLLTALDRHDEAAAELAAIPDGFAFRPRAIFRVELLRRIRREGVTSAAAYVGTGGIDKMLSARDELLADVVRAVARPELAGPGEVMRLRDALRPPSRHRAWLEQVAPTALDAFDRMDDDDALVALAEHRSVLEAEAEAEAEDADRLQRPAPLASSPRSE